MTATPVTAPPAVPARPATVGTPLWTRGLVHWLTVWKHTWKGTVVQAVLNPLLFLGAMGVGLGHYVRSGTAVGQVDGVPYTRFLVPGLLAATAMQVAMNESTWPVHGAIKWRRTYYAMLSTPLRVRDVMAGHLAFIAINVGISSLAFVVVAALLGDIPSVATGVLAVLAAALTGMAFAAPVAAFAAHVDNDGGFAVLYRLGMVPLFLFSGTFFPIHLLPAWLQPVAWVTPLSHGVALCRDLVLGHGSALVDAGHAGYLVGLGVVGLWLCRRQFRKRLEQ